VLVVHTEEVTGSITSIAHPSQSRCRTMDAGSCFNAGTYLIFLAERQIRLAEALDPLARGR